MIADAALAGSSRIVVLHAKSLKDLDRTIVHFDRQRQCERTPGERNTSRIPASSLSFSAAVSNCRMAIRKGFRSSLFVCGRSR